jgi:hypothetical protein
MFFHTSFFVWFSFWRSPCHYPTISGAFQIDFIWIICGLF